MAASESQLIERYFRELGASRDDTVLGIGDDAALLRVPGDCELALTTDALVEGVHFLPGAPARALGHRALAVNLSDIAAMGASPSWALLSLNLPAADEAWLREFSAGFGAPRAQPSRGPGGWQPEPRCAVDHGRARRRWSRKDRRCGATGRAPAMSSISAAVSAMRPAACKLLQGEARAAPAEAAYLQQRFECPTPRVALGQALRGIASACIDVSDGVHIDATRLLAASGCAATVEIERLPLSAPLRHALGDRAWQAALCGGEDYELCFTAAPAQAAAVAALASRTGQRGDAHWRAASRQRPDADRGGFGDAVLAFGLRSLRQLNIARRPPGCTSGLRAARCKRPPIRDPHHSPAVLPTLILPAVVQGSTGSMKASAPKTAHAIKIPERIGKYLIINEVGRGSTGHRVSVA